MEAAELLGVDPKPPEYGGASHAYIAWKAREDRRLAERDSIRTTRDTIVFAKSKRQLKSEGRVSRVLPERPPYLMKAPVVARLADEEVRADEVAIKAAVAAGNAALVAKLVKDRLVVDEALYAAFLYGPTGLHDWHHEARQHFEGVRNARAKLEKHQRRVPGRTSYYWREKPYHANKEPVRNPLVKVDDRLAVGRSGRSRFVYTDFCSKDCWLCAHASKFDMKTGVYHGE